MRWKRFAAMLGGLALVMTATGAPAQAQTRYVSDGNNPAMAYGDVERVQLDHAPRNVFTKVTYYRHWPGESLDIYFDTKKRNRGPEFRLSVTVITQYKDIVDHWRLVRVGKFGTRGTEVACKGDRASRTKRHAIFTAVPRRCLAIKGKKPRRVRVSIRSASTYDGKDGDTRMHDWAPSKKRFGPWVKRG